MNAETAYLDAGVLGTTIHSFQAGRVGHSEEVANIMMGMNGVESFKCPRRPNLQVVNQGRKGSSKLGEGWYIDDRITATGEEEISIFREMQIQDTFLVSTNREDQIVVLKRPCLSSMSFLCYIKSWVVSMSQPRTTMSPP